MILPSLFLDGKPIVPQHPRSPVDNVCQCSIRLDMNEDDALAKYVETIERELHTTLHRVRYTPDRLIQMIDLTVLC